MVQRPYVLLAASVLAEAQRAIEQALAGWCADWGVARSEIVLDVVRAWEGAGRVPAMPSWRQPWCAGERALMFTWPDSMPAQLQYLMFGADHGSGPEPLAQATGEAALLALSRALADAVITDGAAGVSPSPPPSSTWRHASGALLVVLQVGRLECHAVLNCAATARLAREVVTATQLPLAPVDLAAVLAPVPVRLPVCLGTARVDLGGLASLAPGDVIRVGAAADDPLRIRAPGTRGTALFDGYLGKIGKTMALEVVSHDLKKGTSNE